MAALLRLWQALPFAGRLLVTASLALVIAGAVMLYTSARRDAEEAHADLRRVLDDELNTLPAALSEILVIGDFASLQQTLDSHVDRGDIARLAFLDVSGIRVEAVDKPDPLRAPGWFVDWLGVTDLTGKADAEVGGRNYGTLEVTITARSAINRSWGRLQSHLSILLLAIGLDFLGIWLVLRGGLRPLRALDAGSRALARGELDVRIPVLGSPELRRSIESFNRMADAVREASRQLHLEKEQLRVTLASIGDAVLATDAEGRVQFMNAEAERLSGWSEAEALGQPLETVLRLIHETTRATQPNPVEIAIREGIVVGLANHTLLIARDGTERPVADSAAPIRLSEGGAIIGAVMVFRDQSREHQHLADLRASEARLSAVIRGFPGALLMEDEQRRVILTNQAFCEMFDLCREPEELVGTDGRVSTQAGVALFSEPDAFKQRLENLLAEHRTTLQEQYTLRDGRILERDYIPIVDEDRFLGHLRIYRDVTARRQAEAQTRLAASVFESTHEGIAITDARGNILDVNQAFTRITGYERDEVLGQNPRVLKSGHHDGPFYDAMWTAILRNGYWSGEIWNRRKDGEVYPAMLTISAVQDSQGQISHFVGISTDISLLKQHEQQLERIAHYDALTGVPNRVLLADRMQQAIAQARRSGKLLAIAYLDLDGFKPINDTHGHEAGDRLLVEIARRLKDSLRGGDTVARLGGDEFVLLLQDLERVEECEATLGRVLDVISAPVHLPRQTVSVSASIGVSLYPTDDADPDTLLRHADQAMYLAKQAGRNRYHLFDPEHDRRVRSHREALERIGRAMTEGEFELYYQPKVNMRDGQVLGAEALIRWNHPERGLLTPAEFLPLLENTELEATLGNWVIDTALDQMAVWRREGLDLTISVNVAANHIQQRAFVDNLAASLRRHPELPHGRLQLEILESAALEDMARVAEIIEECRKLGVTFALDDFGTGYSSLAYLKRLPAETLKIDQSFVRDMLKDPEDLAIVEGVIALTEAFGRTVVAEGVETVEHGLLLLQLGCEHAQGYGIARPMPAAALPGWTARWTPDPLWEGADQHRWPSQDFALFLAELNHREWIASLAAQLTGNTQLDARPLPLEPELCRFGRWYHGSGHVRYGHRPEFRAIAPVHDRIHALGMELMEQARNGRPELARQHLPELFALRDDMLARLRALQESVLSRPVED